MNAGSSTPTLRAYRPRQFPDLIRIGSRYDGGYVLPAAALRASGALLSLGVEANWDFEEAALRLQPALTITCVDGTTGPEVIRARALKELRRALVRVRPVKTLRMLRLLRQAAAFRRFFAAHEFLPLMVAASDGDGTASLATLLAHVRRGNAERWVLVKMDIEGAEYDSLAAADGRLERVSVLAVEFHELGRNWSRFTATMQRLAEQFVIAHVHGNNCLGYVPGTPVPETLEITLVHRSLVPGILPAAVAAYPLPLLDAPNDRRRPDLTLNFE
jgi:hypothetical protein